MSKELLEQLVRSLDEGRSRRVLLDTYYRGKQPLAFMSPEARTAVGNRLDRMVANIPRLAVTSLAERLRVNGFDGADVWADWLRNDMDQLAPVAHREALTVGESFVIVWSGRSGRPLVTVESAEQVAVRRDPATREVVAAAKRWERHGGGTEAVLYLPDRITRFRSRATGAVSGFEPVETLANPFGVVPVVPLRNSDRLLGEPGSEIDDLIPLVDGLNKTLADLMVSSEYAGRPRRWATGIELVEEDVLDEAGRPTGETRAVNPFPEGNRMMVTDHDGAKFGQLASADLAGYEAAVRVFTSQIMAVSALPAHYVGALTNQPASADALRAAEASLTARAEARQAVFGRSWEQVARLVVAARDGVDPAGVDVRVQWADPATRSVAQEADAVVKLFQAGLLPQTYALRKLGYAPADIEAIRADTRTDVLDRAGADAIERLLS